MLQACALLATTATAANAQFPAPQTPIVPQTQQGPFDQYVPNINPNTVMPNIYNPQYQPLSPYLYTVRGANPAVDYYFGTRPGTLGLGARGGPNVPFVAQGVARAPFFPQLVNTPEPFQTDLTTSPGSVLPPAGHPVVFNNTIGFFPGPYGLSGGGRPGVAGIPGQKK
jgi:hypothetical protein